MEQYKKVIAQMTEDINEAVRKLKERDDKIERLEQVVKHYELGKR